VLRGGRGWPGSGRLRKNYGRQELKKEEDVLTQSVAASAQFLLSMHVCDYSMKKQAREAN
jgi:hypothetical protein